MANLSSSAQYDFSLSDSFFFAPSISVHGPLEVTIILFDFKSVFL